MERPGKYASGLFYIWDLNKNTSKLGFISALFKWGEKVGYYFILTLTFLTIIHFAKILLLEFLLVGVLFKGRNYLKSVNRIALERNIDIFTTENINDDKTYKYLKDIKPDVILSNNFHQIIKEKVLKLAKNGCINIHPGKLPLYRGLLPHFWSMVNKDTEGGVTLHYIDKGVDTGGVILEENIKISKKESFYKVWTKTADVGSRLLKKYFRNLRKGKEIKAKPERKDRKVNYFSFPTKKAFSKFKSHGFSLYKFKDFF
jgi:methionyl-tRNA formyltransferase